MDGSVQPLSQAERDRLYQLATRFARATQNAGPDEVQDPSLDPFNVVASEAAKWTAEEYEKMIEGRVMTSLRFMLGLMLEEGYGPHELPTESDLRRYATYISLAGERATYRGFLVARE